MLIQCCSWYLSDIIYGMALASSAAACAPVAFLTLNEIRWSEYYPIDYGELTANPTAP